MEPKDQPAEVQPPAPKGLATFTIEELLLKADALKGAELKMKNQIQKLEQDAAELRSALVSNQQIQSALRLVVENLKGKP